ncbi:hypothetical protein SLEP1_g49956 [Rubroshorea leprosula]|uniref:RNase H type-1 domain-containing protein n=1 Tax=Rubroshorea leprosula TaxID=152421 RepID=A0AAV5M0S8_9ROSI|nr:hypothetical protein SLEP1_g49956 [Rubroshorea leprosula]
MDNLQRKHVLVDLECPVCGSDMESVAHCVLFCPVAWAVWRGSPLSLRVSELPSSSFADFFDAMCTELGKAQLELLCTLSWRIWGSRNDAHWNGRRAHPQQIIEGGMNYLMDYQRAQKSMERGSRAVQMHSETKWKPPDERTVKINVDGAIAEQHRVFGVGAMARDHCGEVLATMAYQGRVVAAAKIVEAYLGNILLDCKLLMSSFLHCQVKHVRQTGNAVAHELAKRELQGEGDEFLRDEIPDYLAPFATRDKLSM